MEEYSTVWSERKVESKVHWPIRNFRENWPCGLLIGTPSGVVQITRCVSCVNALEIPL